MIDFSAVPFQELLKPEGFPCACGKRHATTVREVVIGRGAVTGLPELIKKLGVSKPFAVWDPNTYAAAGECVSAILGGAGIPFASVKLREGDPEPDEAALGQLAMAFDPSCDGILAVGSGVINDLCKMLSLVTGRKSVIVGTAPSMDGFASNSSSMLAGGVKTSIYNPCPEGILLDTDLLCAAPMRMLRAGLGDMLAKYISVPEWRLSHLITGDYYCENIAGLVRRSAREVRAQAGKLPERDPEAAAEIAKGLVMSGVAMSFAESSRPASGLEHYFSHVWDMRAIEAGKRPDLHGIQVGVGSVLTLRIYEWILEIIPDRARAEAHMRGFSPAAWESEVRRAFGGTAGEILRIEEQTRKNDPAKHAARLEIILSNWNGILAMIREELPPLSEILRLAEAVGLPTRPSELGISDDDAVDAFLRARDIRDKYMSCNLLWDLGLLDEFAERLRASL